MGIATTRIDREGNWVDYNKKKVDEYVLVQLSTDDQKNDVAISLKRQGYIDDDDVKSAVIKAGFVAIAKKLRKRIERKKKSDPAFCPSEISNELLAKMLDTLSWWEGKQIFWEEFEPEIEIKIDKNNDIDLDL